MNAAADASAPAPTKEGADDARVDAHAFVRVLAALLELGAALRRVATTTLALCAAEARVLRASAVLLFVGSVALVAVAVSLWACVVALIGWALVIATGSIGAALGILVALHVLLVAALWFALRYAWRQATFPAARAELRVLGDEIRGHVRRFQHALPPDRDADP
ncbi:MAG TPA: hypothetical protein VFQ95_04935 [Rhodanobacteraceae bacterium]|nr:hypothetical protein [Rhodanobacteraceae bacterium]